MTIPKCKFCGIIPTDNYIKTLFGCVFCGVYVTNKEKWLEIMQPEIRIQNFLCDLRKRSLAEIEAAERLHKENPCKMGYYEGVIHEARATLQHIMDL